MIKGNLYMLTATEITLIKEIVTDYLGMEGADSINGQDALEILNKIKPITLEETMAIILEEDEEPEEVEKDSDK